MGNEEIYNYLKHAFMNLEWSPEGAWLVNAGAMVENYRAVNYHFLPAQVMRLTASKAIRAPSMFEYATDYAACGAKTNVYSGDTLIGPWPDIDIASWGGTRQTRMEGWLPMNSITTTQRRSEDLNWASGCIGMI